MNDKGISRPRAKNAVQGIFARNTAIYPKRAKLPRDRERIAYITDRIKKLLFVTV